jgi:hypothetical protein
VLCCRSPYISQEVTVQVPSAPVVVPSDQLSPTSVLSEGNESFVDCDSKRTDSLSDDREQFRELEVASEDKLESEVELEVKSEPEPVRDSPSLERTEATETDVCDEVVAESTSTLEKLSRESVESVESVVSSLSVVSDEVGRRTSVIDPPSGFQTSTPSSKEDIHEPEEAPHPPVVQPWTRCDLRTSSKLFRGQSVDVSIIVYLSVVIPCLILYI